MIINSTRSCGKPKILPPNQIDRAEKYIVQKLEEYLNEYPNEKFSVRILFGGDKRDWNGTDLQEFYNHYAALFDDEKAKNRAANAVGRLLKYILQNDNRTYEITGRDTGNNYKLI